jgi:hypothetical protein
VNSLACVTPRLEFGSSCYVYRLRFGHVQALLAADCRLRRRQTAVTDSALSDRLDVLCMCDLRHLFMCNRRETCVPLCLLSLDV